MKRFDIVFDYIVRTGKSFRYDIKIRAHEWRIIWKNKLVIAMECFNTDGYIERQIQICSYCNSGIRYVTRYVEWSYMRSRFLEDIRYHSPPVPSALQFFAEIIEKRDWIKIAMINFRLIKIGPSQYFILIKSSRECPDKAYLKKTIFKVFSEK